jgi:Domain of unknown function (DUF1874).
MPKFISKGRRIVLLNTSVITAQGEFSYKEISLLEARKKIRLFKKSNLEIMSTIGHESTAQILSDLLNTEVKVNRINYVQLPTDICIVFRLKDRTAEGRILTKEELGRTEFVFGILIMHSSRKTFK